MTAIKVENLTKIYHLYDSPTARLKEALHPLRKKYHHDFYALRDVSFEVQKGEVLGIIGKNGSGKSTLLKILARVLTQTAGAVVVNGNVSALLELGGGFNPEFTGIENIYFSSSIMGYTKEEVDKQLDEIIAFADIGEFLYQPVKTYSSGMSVRLAFAVAINVDPDILIVDEALAVGDEAFQRKCYGKIRAIQERGTTILFVSHSSGTIIEVCQKAMLLDLGELLIAGSPKLVVSKYHQFLYAEDSRRQALRDEIQAHFLQHGNDDEKIDVGEKSQTEHRSQYQSTLKEFYDPDLKPETTVVYSNNNDYGVKICDVRLTTSDGIQVNNLVCGREYIYTYNVDFKKPGYRIRFGMLIKNVTGLEIAGCASSPPKQPIAYIGKDTTVSVQFRFKCLLHPGTYFMNAGVNGLVHESEGYLERIIDVMMFRVQPEEQMFETGLVSFLVEPSYFIESSN